MRGCSLGLVLALMLPTTFAFAGDDKAKADPADDGARDPGDDAPKKHKHKAADGEVPSAETHEALAQWLLQDHIEQRQQPFVQSMPAQLRHTFHCMSA